MLIDGFDRKVDYIRISVTSRCNFRCQYCMPTTPFEDFKEEVVELDKLFNFIKVAIDNGVKKIRLTGGEPTLREGLDEFIKSICDYDNSVDIALTTNGYLLKSQAKKLKDAGLKRINISLDSLKSDRAKKIAQKDVLKGVLEGIDESLKVGLGVKVNMVPIKGVNDDEIVDILRYCLQKGVAIRFIEYMENQMASSTIRGLKADEILELISQSIDFEEKEKDFFGPARLFELKDGNIFGIISPHSSDFCDSCNRIRVSANGDLIPCLYFDEAISAKKAMESNDEKEIERLIKQVVKEKPEKNRWSEGESSARAFYQTGG